MPTRVSIVLLLVFYSASVARADFVGPSHADSAISPSGSLVVRIGQPKPTKNAKGTADDYDVIYYEFDDSRNTYVRSSSFVFDSFLPNLLYVSDDGDLIMVSLSEEGSIRLYSKEGELARTWSLADFLSQDEIAACAMTGSTLQWLEEGGFYGRFFFFRGPSRLIRALSPPYTVMREANHKVEFSGTVDATIGELTKQASNEP